MASAGPDAADRLLSALAAGAPVDGRHVAIVVAHPDDETIGIGGQLALLADVVVVHVTDGAPRNGGDAVRHGFGTRQAYARARRAELEAAVHLAGVPADALIGLGLPDQEAGLQLAALARRLADVLGEHRIEVVLTHAYEGGHPDHDATAFAVRAAARLAGVQGVVEMPFYRAAPEGWAKQSFMVDPRVPAIAIWLDADARASKQRMMAAHASQAETLAGFDVKVERFRRAPAHDFAVPPNGGDLLYERYPWGMTGPRWQALVRAAQADLTP